VCQGKWQPVTGFQGRETFWETLEGALSFLRYTSHTNCFSGWASEAELSGTDHLGIGADRRSILTAERIMSDTLAILVDLAPPVERPCLGGTREREAAVLLIRGHAKGASGESRPWAEAESFTEAQAASVMQQARLNACLHCSPTSRPRANAHASSAQPCVHSFVLPASRGRP